MPPSFHHICNTTYKKTQIKRGHSVIYPWLQLSAKMFFFKSIRKSPTTAGCVKDLSARNEINSRFCIEIFGTIFLPPLFKLPS